jgi:putative addiction module component (TIGR02574 family)
MASTSSPGGRPISSLPHGLGQLPASERLALAQDLWDSVTAEVEKAPLTEAQTQEVDRRLAAHQANPQAAISWEQVEAEALARLRK